MAEIQVGTQFESAKPRSNGDEKVRVLLVGDFGLAPDAAIATCNRSTFAELVSQLRPAIHTGLTDSEGNDIRVSIGSIDDFHPDELFAKAPAFARLRQLRRQLNMPARSDEAAREIESWLSPSAANDQSEQAELVSEAPPEANPLDTSNLFDSVLSNTAADASAADTAANAGPWANLIGEIVDSSRIHTITQSVKNAESLVDDTMAHLMRRILASPRFREIEACWRSLDFLVRRADSGSVELGILQLSRQAFIELTEEGQVERLAARVGFGQEIPGKQPWSVVLPLYIGLDDTLLVAAAHGLAQAGGEAAIMCGLDASTLDEAAALANSSPWRALQGLPNSADIHCACPGFLLRLPYGDKQGRVENFEFEELRRHDASQLCWGSAALLTCFALIKNFEQGVAAESGQTAEGLPLHVYQEHGSTQLHPTCRFQLTQASAGELRELGISPIIGYHEDDKAQIPGIFSVRGTPLT